MKPKWSTLLIVTIVWAGYIHVSAADPFAKGPFLGQIPPGSEAQVFAAPFMDNTQSPAMTIPVKKGNLKGCHPGIAPDKSFMVFYSIRPGARSGTETDLYLTLQQPDGSWTKPRHMGPRANSGYYEFGARISPDKKYLFFTRSTGWSSKCAADIYWVDLKDYLPESHW